MKHEKEVRAWLLDKERIRLSRDRYTPNEQDLLCVLDILEYPEYAWATENEHAARVAASIVLGDMLSARQVLATKTHFFRSMDVCTEPYDVYKCDICRRPMHEHTITRGAWIGSNW